MMDLKIRSEIIQKTVYYGSNGECFDTEREAVESIVMYELERIMDVEYEAMSVEDAILLQADEVITLLQAYKNAS